MSNISQTINRAAIIPGLKEKLEKQRKAAARRAAILAHYEDMKERRAQGRAFDVNRAFIDRVERLILHIDRNTRRAGIENAETMKARRAAPIAKYTPRRTLCPLETYSRAIVNSCAVGADLRGMDSNRNTYRDANHIDDFRAIAAVEIADHTGKGLYPVTLSDGRTVFNFTANLETDAPSVFARRACNRYEKQLTRRAEKTVNIDQSIGRDSRKPRAETCAAIERFADNNAARDFIKRALDYIDAAPVTDKQRVNMRNLLLNRCDDIKQPAAVRKQLLRLMQNAGLIENDCTGKIMIAD